jgi:hypothetical protein
MEAIKNTLTPEERQEFTECNAIIRSGIDSFYEVGTALINVSDKRLYREPLVRAALDFAHFRKGESISQHDDRVTTALFRAIGHLAFTLETGTEAEKASARSILDSIAQSDLDDMAAHDRAAMVRETPAPRKARAAMARHRAEAGAAVIYLLFTLTLSLL